MSSAFLSDAASTTMSAMARGARSVLIGTGPCDRCAATPRRAQGSAGRAHERLARADVEAGRVEHDRAHRAVELGRAGTTRDEDRRELADAIGRLPAREVGE